MTTWDACWPDFAQELPAPSSTHFARCGKPNRRSTCWLADYTGGPVAAALEDREHPLDRAGGTLTIRRANADRISGDLMITKPNVRVQALILHEASVLADGVPAPTWQIVELAYGAPEGDPANRAQYGWQQLWHTTEPATIRQWDAIRHLHSAAQAAAAALALDRPPHSLPTRSKSVRDALLALRDAGSPGSPNHGQGSSPTRYWPNGSPPPPVPQLQRRAAIRRGLANQNYVK